MFGILAMVSCKDSNKENMENDQYAIDTPDYNMDNAADDLNNNTEANIDNEGVVIIDEEYLVYNSEDMRDMYDALDMSQEQINQFETDFHNKIDNMVEDPSKSLDKEKMKPEMDKTLKEVLTVEQYKKYEQWKKEHSNI